MNKGILQQNPIKISSYWRRKWIELTYRLGLRKASKISYYNDTANDRWISEYIFPDRRDGYFIEAGAANGIDFSSCYVLEARLGWTGICIEPNDYFYRQLIENRPNSICENVCLSNNAGEVCFVEGDEAAEDERSVSSYYSGIETNLKTFKSKAGEIINHGRRVNKNADTLQSILKRNNAPKTIDYAALDIEGSELRALEVFPFDEYQILAISLECDWKIWKPISKLLKSKDYREVKNPFNRDKSWERYWLHGSLV